MSRFLAAGVGAAVLVSLVPPHPATAQTQQDIDRASDEANKIRQLQQQRLRDERRKQKEQPRSRIDATPESRDEDAGSEQCWDIDVIQLDGVTLLDPWDRQEIRDTYEGRCLRLGDINAILNDVTTAYFDKGYITSRAYIAPNQDLSTGVLIILVVEGKLEKILLEDGKDGTSVALGMTFPGLVGAPFNLRDIEQGLDQVNRLPSNNATIAIEPGTEAGNSVLVIRNEARDPFTYSFSGNDLGSETTGKEQFTAMALVDNPWGLSDQFTLSLTHTYPIEPRRYSESMSSSYSVPFGYFTGSIDTSYSQFATPIPLTGGDVARSSGTTFDISGTLDRVLYRDQDSLVSGSLTLGRKRVRNYFQDSRIDASSYNMIWLTTGGAFNTVVLGGLLDGTFSVVQGLDLFDSDEDRFDLPAGSAAQAQFTKYEASLGYQRQFPLGSYATTSLSTNTTAQFSDDVLYSAEQISLGGYYTVRGYPNVSLSGDNGLYVRNELSITPTLPDVVAELGFSPSVFAAYDFGRVWGHYGSDKGNMSGYAYGGRLSHDAFSFELMTSRPISYPSFIGNPAPDVHFVFSTTGDGWPGDFLDLVDQDHDWISDRGFGLDWLGGGWFAGIETGRMDMSLNNVYVADAAYTLQKSEAYEALRFGKKLGRSRLYARVFEIEQPDGFDYSRYDLNFETKLLDTIVAPYIGASLGWMSYCESYLDIKSPNYVITKDNKVFKEDIRLSGPMYGLKAGLIYDGPYVSAYLAYELSKLESRDTLYFDGVAEKFEMRQVNTITAGLDVKF